MTAADRPPPRRRPLGRGAADPAPGPEPAPGARSVPPPAQPAAPPAVPEPRPAGPGEPAAPPGPQPAAQRPAGPPDPEPPDPEPPDPDPGPPGPGADGPPAPDADPDPPAAPAPRPPAAAGAPEVPEGTFTVRLKNFEGPFDLLLQLISRHKLDVTEVALSKVTDEFIAHIHGMGQDWDLDQATEFLVVAATLLDLKAARLLPAAEIEDEEDLALLEARDLLFARLLQYRAYKRVAGIFAERLAEEARHHPRTVGLEPHHAQLLPEVVISIGPENFARLAVKAMQPRPRPQIYVDHIHAPLVSVREQAAVVVAILREAGAAHFTQLTADAPDTLTVVARFLALLELYREKAVALDQDEALGALLVRWTGGTGEAPGPHVTGEFDPEDVPPRRKDDRDDR